LSNSIYVKNSTITPERLLTPLVLEDGIPFKAASFLLYVISAFLLAGIAWASVAEIREIAHAPGEIAPVGSTRTVQHLEGGIVLQIMVDEGDKVEANQPLILLQRSEAVSNLAQVKSRLARLTLEKARLEAETNNKKPEFGVLKKQYPELAADQYASHQSNTSARNREQKVLEARIAQKEVNSSSAFGEYYAIYEQYKAEREKFQIQEKLLEEGFTSKSQYLSAKAVYNRVLSEKIAAKGRLDATNKALAEAEAALAKVQADNASRLANQLAKISAERAEVAEKLTNLQDRVERLYIRAPVAGLVKQVLPKSTGSVIGPGDIVAEIIPTGHELVAVVRLKPKDIGHVEPGDEAIVNITSYDTSRYGSLSGKVRSVSAGSFKSEDGKAFFKVVLSIGESSKKSTSSGKMILSPGMAVNAEIVTDKKSLTRYILKPVYSSLDSAFTER
jgi:HlyD family type I secretion membrane fusion protein